MPPTPPMKQAESGYGTGPTPPLAYVTSPKMWVSRSFPTGDQFEQQNLEAQVFATTPATVTAIAGRTINTGDYESIRIDVGVTLPCYVEEIEAAIEAATEFVGKHVTAEQEAIRATLQTKSQSA